MPSDRDADSGKFTRQYKTEEFITAVEEIDSATTTEIAELVGCSYDLAYRRLNQLNENGEIAKTEIGSTFVWQLI